MFITSIFYYLYFSCFQINLEITNPSINKISKFNNSLFLFILKLIKLRIKYCSNCSKEYIPYLMKLNITILLFKGFHVTFIKYKETWSWVLKLIQGILIYVIISNMLQKHDCCLFLFIQSIYIILHNLLHYLYIAFILGKFVCQF